MKRVLFLLILITLFSCNGGGTSSVSIQTGTEVSGTGEDPLAPYAWHLENTGQSSFAANGGTVGEDMKIKSVIESGIKGGGIRIAVSDSGVEVAHPDLSGNQLTGEHRNYSSATPANWHNSDPYPDEGEGHGTSVTGLIAALGWNGIGSRGVAPSSKFAGFYFIGDFHDTESSYEAKTLDQMNGNFDIFNYSWGYPGCEFIPADETVIDAYKSGVTNLRSGKGAIYVKAAGNDYIGSLRDCYSNLNYSYFGNTNTSEDQGHPYVILTGALNAKGEKSSYSTPGSGLWVSAPGGEFGDTNPAMITTDMQGCAKGLSTSSSNVNDFNKGGSPNHYCNYTNIMNGTSSAAPSLSGVIALILEANPALTWRDVKHILAMSADKIKYSTSAISHPAGSSGALSGYTYDYRYVVNDAGVAFSNLYGFGRVNAENAVAMAKTYSMGSLGTYLETQNPNTNDWYYKSGNVNIDIPDDSSVGASHIMAVVHNFKIESVQVRLSTNHAYVGDLGVELTSPLNTVSRLLLINNGLKDSGLVSQMLLTNAFYGENSKGNWKIKIVDAAADDIGKLQNWELKINGRVVSSDGVAPAAVTAITNSATYASLTDSPPVSFTASVSTDVLRYEVRIVSSTNQIKADWYSIGNTNSFTTKSMTLSSGQTYTIQIRTIDTSETVSSTVATSTWTVN